jgi:outer membrane protein assembly factor BamB
MTGPRQSIRLLLLTALAIGASRPAAAVPEPKRGPEPRLARLIAVDLKTGEAKQLREVKEQAISLLAAGNGVICVREGWRQGFGTRTIRGLKADTGDVLWSRDSGEYTYGAGWLRHEYLAYYTMTDRLQFPVGQAIRDGVAVVVIPRDDRFHGEYVAGVDARTGEVRWKLGPSANKTQDLLPIWVALHVNGNLVAAADSTRSWGLERTTGKVLWETTPATGFVSDDDTLIGWKSEAELWRASRRTGKIEETLPLRRYSEPVGLWDGKLVLREYTGDTLVARDKERLGRTVWERKLERRGTPQDSNVVLHEGTAYWRLDHQAELPFCLSLTDGSVKYLAERWPGPPEGYANLPVGVHGDKLYAASDYGVLAIDLKTKERKWAWTVKDLAKDHDTSVSMATLSGDVLYVAAIEWSRRR